MTGASGFLGKKIYSFFKDKNYLILTVGRSKLNNLICDLSIETPKIPTEKKINIAIHVAGKAHVIPKNKNEKQEFYNVNVQGTKNFLKSLESNLPQFFFYISSVSVYGVDSGIGIDETFPLKGETPYSKSKIMAENEVLKFGKKFNVKVLILRLPLIVGKNPLGNLESMIKAIQKGYYFRVGRGDAKRSIISTLQVAISIEKLVGKEGVFNIIDSEYPRINEIDQHIADIYSKKIKTIPRFVFKILSLLGDILPFLPLNSLKYGKLTNSLVFSNLKLLQETNWTPVDSLKDLK
mgnify:FL=1